MRSGGTRCAFATVAAMVLWMAPWLSTCGANQAPRGQSHGASCLNTAKQDVEEVLDFRSNTHVFENAAITAFDRDWIVSGVETDASAEDVSAIRRVRVVGKAEGDIGPPRRSVPWPMEFPTPVTISGKRWGLIWAEAEPVGTYSGKWLPTMLTHLWFAERSAKKWETPVLVLQTSLSMSWGTERNIQIAPDQGTFLSVIAIESLSQHRIMFGRLGVDLYPVPMNDELLPDATSFVIDSRGRITLVAHVLTKSSLSAPGVFLLMTSGDGGKSWSRPQRIWRPSEGAVRAVRLHQDAKSTLHLLWTSGNGNVMHHAAASTTNEWKDVPVPFGKERIVGWVSGINQCGKLAVIAALPHPRGPDFQATLWEGKWSALQDAFPDFRGVYLFDGVGRNGSWFVGWSGDRVTRSTPLTIKAWTTRQ